MVVLNNNCVPFDCNDNDDDVYSNAYRFEFFIRNYVLGKALPSSQQLVPKAESISLVSCSKNLLGEEQIVKRFWGIPLF